ncbi:MAG TPA: putative DNA modification/repair radical SAM protein [Spirochaetia bacterium]|nr:MAG: putative DNA modification/repair radical SAM protein [Spirochaetes bacterium GWB1_36_13]HCL55795.1 putative DNA modification/repair radical SAM protein [Spirochaetia bacterium]
MELLKKLQILSDAAKYDVSCSSSGSQRLNQGKGIGNAALAGICHSFADDGRCISLLKILMTNVCIYDCSYCLNRKSNDVPRAVFTPDEIALLTIQFYQRNYIEGLFLSSGIIKSPDFTMERLVEAVQKLREVHHFNGYIHMKAIPGADPRLIHKAGLYADRLSVNIELPSENSLQKLAPDKSKTDILKPMSWIGNEIKVISEEQKKTRRKLAPFAPAGQSTQLIVGASPESDFHILTLSENLYQKFSLKRVYYSAYVPVNQDNKLPMLVKPPLVRENRLYQADWLLRFYGFQADEILDPDHNFLDLELDPKEAWAIRNFHLFPVEINKADYETLLRVPGVGVKSALRIVKARKQTALTFEGLKKIGVVLKRAKYFITCAGKSLYSKNTNEANLKRALTSGSSLDDCYTLF